MNIPNRVITAAAKMVREDNSAFANILASRKGDKIVVDATDGKALLRAEFEDAGYRDNFPALPDSDPVEGCKVLLNPAIAVEAAKMAKKAAGGRYKPELTTVFVSEDAGESIAIVADPIGVNVKLTQPMIEGEYEDVTGIIANAESQVMEGAHFSVSLLAKTLGAIADICGKDAVVNFRPSTNGGPSMLSANHDGITVTAPVMPRRAP